MFFRDVQPKEGIKLDVDLANVHVPVKLGRDHAHKFFAEPLKAQMTVASLGTVLDCRSRVRSDGQIKGVDLYLGMRDSSRNGLLSVARMLETLAAPCGSSIRLAEGISDPIIFGRTEGLELSIDAAADRDMCNRLAESCETIIDNIGVSHGWSRAQDRNLFYFYGENFDEMKARLDQLLEGLPEFDNAVVKRVA